MIWILFIKIVLITISIISLGVMPLIALLNMWIWNEIIIKHVITCGKEITSYWIMLGLTAIGFGISGIVAPASRTIKTMIKDR